MTKPWIGATITLGDVNGLQAELDAHPDWLRAWGADSWMATAASTGRIDILQELHRRGLGANDVGGSGRLPLHEGVEYPDVVRWLLDHGADASRPGVMVAAAARADAATIGLLLAAGGDVAVRSGTPPRNAFEQAQRMGRPPEILDLLRPPPGTFDPFVWLEKALGPLVRPQPTLAPVGSPVDILVTKEKGPVACVTYGLSHHPLPGLDFRAEVMVRLPKGYPETTALGQDPRWPVDWLLTIARKALEATILQPLDTLGNGEPPQPLTPDGPFVGWIVIDEDADTKLPDETTVKLLSLLPLHPAELATARKDPMDLIRAFVAAGLPDKPVISLKRRSTVR